VGDRHDAFDRLRPIGSAKSYIRSILLFQML
jgi:hypothetical protein